MEKQNREKVYNELNRAWKSTCKILFGDEIGELESFKEWFLSGNKAAMRGKSTISGQDLLFPSPNYSSNARFCTNEEILSIKKFEPLNINELKDIDSLTRAVSERLYYSGNIVLGNSNHVSGSTNILDSFYVLDSATVTDSKYVAYVSELRMSEYSFGCRTSGLTKYTIRGYESFNASRGLDISKCFFCNDCFFSHGLYNCNNIMFSFGLRNRNYCIGNLELPAEKYASLKKKILSEIIAELKKNKSYPSLIDLVKDSKETVDAKLLLQSADKIEDEQFDMNKIEESFSQITKVILGKPLTSINEYGNWLSRNVDKPIIGKSCASGKRIIIFDHADFLRFPRDRLLTLEEAERLGAVNKLDISALERNPIPELGKIAYFSPIIDFGKKENLMDCPTQESSVNCYNGDAVYCCKNSSYNYWPRDSDYIFGSSVIFVSSFCLKCYNSKKLSRCFEVDHSRDCSDSYYLHNCENVKSSMFCFNTKNLNYAVGNTAVGKDQFEKTRGMLLEWINGELEKKKDVPLSIFNISNH